MDDHPKGVLTFILMLEKMAPASNSGTNAIRSIYHNL